MLGLDTLADNQFAVFLHEHNYVSCIKLEPIPHLARDSDLKFVTEFASSKDLLDQNLFRIAKKVKDSC